MFQSQTLNLPDRLIQLSVEDKIYLILAIAATSSMLIKWHRFKPAFRILVLYPFAHFAAKFFSGYPIESKAQKLYNESGLVNQDNAYDGVIAEINVKISLTFITYTILAVFFNRTFVKKTLRTRTLVSVPFFWIMDNIGAPKFPWENAMIYSSIAGLIESALIIYWCLSYFRELLTQNHANLYSPENDRTFWGIVGLLFYYIGIIFVGGLNRSLLSISKALANHVYIVEYVFNYTFYGLMILICFIKFPDSDE